MPPRQFQPLLICLMSLQLILGKAILLYQMPKTGSQTVEATMQASSVPHAIFRLHSLSRAQRLALAQCIDSGQASELWKENASIQLARINRISRLLRLRYWLVGCGARIPSLHVVAAVRDVISAGLSGIFENYRLHVRDPEELTIEKCSELLSKLPRICGYCQNWFEDELAAHVGVDVYAKPFPAQAGHCFYENRFARILLYRFDALSKVPPYLSELLGIRIGPLVNRNLSGAKNYSKAYAKAKAGLQLPADFVREQLNSRLMRHFFSDAERASLFAQWTGSPWVADLQPGPTEAVV